MIVDYIVEIGLDAVKEKVLEAKDQQVVRERLKAFLERQEKINVDCTLEEEIDFGGLTNYIRNELIGDVKLRLFGDEKERSVARETIISKAVEYSQAKTALSRKRALTLTEMAIDILRNFYKSKTSSELRFIAAEIEDTIIEANEAQTAAQIKSLSNIITSTAAQSVMAIKTDAEELSIMSIDKNMRLMREDKLTQVESNCTDFFNTMSATHKLFPYYGFNMESVGGTIQFLSKPLLSEATQKYPPKIICIGTVQINGKFVKEFNFKTINYAYRHQFPISINVLTAQKLLGDIPDPAQHEAEVLRGKKITLPPKPFPPAFPCSISLNDDVKFDYILFRTQEILDGGEIVISNREQTSCVFKITMIANLKSQELTYNICVENPNNEDMLNYVRFLKLGFTGAKITIKVLSLGETLATGQINYLDYKSDFESIYEEEAFFEKIVAIEHYFGKNLEIPEIISEDDFESISYLATLVQGEEFQYLWSKLIIPFTLTEELRQKIKEMDDNQVCLTYVGRIAIPIYGETFELTILRTVDSAKIINLARIKQKAEILDIGDEIKLSYLPGESDGVGHWRDKIYSNSGKRQHMSV